MNETNNIRLIDLNSVLRSKNPNLLTIIPKFVIRWAEKLIHQDELNEILTKHGHHMGVDFATASLKHLQVNYEVHGIEKTDPNKRYVIVSNHPLGGLDGIILLEAFGNFFEKNIKLLVNDLLMNVDPLRPVFIPVNKYGRQNVDNAVLIHDAFSSDCQILNFPAGACSRLNKGVIRDLEWKKTFINQAIKYGRDIIPVYFSGRNSNQFYRIAKLRKALGLKFNFEVILLPHEMFKQKKMKFDVFVGDAIPFGKFTNEHNIAFWANYVKEKAYSLKP